MTPCYWMDRDLLFHKEWSWLLSTLWFLINVITLHRLHIYCKVKLLGQQITIWHTVINCLKPTSTYIHHPEKHTNCVQEAVCQLPEQLSVTYESMSGYQRRGMDGVSRLCQILSSLSLGYVASLNWVIEVMTRHGYPRSRPAGGITSLNSMTQHNLRRQYT